MQRASRLHTALVAVSAVACPSHGVDVSEASPIILSRITVEDHGQNDDALLLDNTLYLPGTKSTSSANLGPAILSIDVTDPTNPEVVQQLLPPPGAKNSSFIFTDGERIYTSGNSGISVFDRAQDDSLTYAGLIIASTAAQEVYAGMFFGQRRQAPVPVPPPSQLPFSVTVPSVPYDDGIARRVSITADTLFLLFEDSTRFIDSAGIPVDLDIGNGQGVIVDQRGLLFMWSGAGLVSFSDWQIGQPRLLGQGVPSQFPNDVAVAGPLLLTARPGAGLGGEIIDVSDPIRPRVLASLRDAVETPIESGRTIDVRGTTAFLVARALGRGTEIIIADLSPSIAAAGRRCFPDIAPAPWGDLSIDAADTQLAITRVAAGEPLTEADAGPSDFGDLIAFLALHDADCE